MMEYLHDYMQSTLACEWYFDSIFIAAIRIMFAYNLKEKYWAAPFTIKRNYEYVTTR